MQGLPYRFREIIEKQKKDIIEDKKIIRRSKNQNKEEEEKIQQRQRKRILKQNEPETEALKLLNTKTGTPKKNIYNHLLFWETKWNPATDMNATRKPNLTRSYFRIWNVTLVQM